MLNIKCDFCPKYLEEPGAILFGPPRDNFSRKLHLCVDCFHRILYQNNIDKVQRPMEHSNEVVPHSEKTYC